MRPRDGFRLEPCLGCEGDKQLFVRDHIVEHRLHKRGICSGRSQVMRTKTGQVQEAVQPIRVGGDEC